MNNQTGELGDCVMNCEFSLIGKLQFSHSYRFSNAMNMSLLKEISANPWS